MSSTAFGTSYSFARRTAAVAMVSLAAMLLVATLSIAALFLRAQIEHSRASALTQANVASSTMAAAMRFGGYEVINDALRVFDTGANHDSAAAYDRAGKLVAQLVAPREADFPSQLSDLRLNPDGWLQARPVKYVLRDENVIDGTVLGTLVVTPNQEALRDTVMTALLALAVVLAFTLALGVLLARRLTAMMVRPLHELTEWAEAVSASRNINVAAPAPRGGAIEVMQLTSSFERLVMQIAEQNRELKRRQYELKASNAHLESVAFSDPLTGLPNRVMFESTLQSAIDRANASGVSLAVLFIDVDRLKQINDQFGHVKGDAALRAVASRIRRALRGTDFLARLAGDEFVVVTSNIASSGDAVKLAERLTVWLGIALPEDQWQQPVRASIGVAVFPDHGEDVQALVHAADVAMYRAKALPVDEPIRVVGATIEALAPAPRNLSNVINLPAPGRKTQSGRN